LFRHFGQSFLNGGKYCIVAASSLIKEQATEAERKAGFDLTDYLVRFFRLNLRLEIIKKMELHRV
jgi:hypothetical protein